MKKWHARLQDTAASTRIETLAGVNGVAARNASLFTAANGPGTILTKSLDFNGTSDKIAVGAVQGCPVGANVRTICGWFNVDVFGTTNEKRIASQNAGGAGAGTGLELYAANGALAVGFNGHRVQTPASALSTGTWHHAAIVVPNGATTTGNVKVYIDGVNQTLTTLAGSSQTLNTGTTDFILGNSSSLFFDGKLADWRIYNTDESADLAGIMSEAGNDVGVVLTNVNHYQTLQRNGSNQATLTITGTSSAAVEARHNGGSYAALATPSGGTFSGSLTITGQGLLEVRQTSDTSKIASRRFVGAGDVFVVAGQSNAEGKVTNYQSYSHATLKATKFVESGVWAELTDPSDSDTGVLGSVWPLVATLHMADQSVPFCVITTSDDGTGLCSPNADWLPPSGANYTNMTSVVTASGVNSVKGVLIFQGEKDAANSVVQATYYANSQTFAAAAKTDLPGSPLTLWAIIDSTLGTEASLDPIRLAQVAAWSTTNIRPGPTTQDISLVAAPHFTLDAETTPVANRWWLAIAGNYFGGSYGTAPRIASATLVGSTITVTYDQDLASGTTYGGYSFTDSGTPITVNSATKSGTRTVAVVLNSAPSGTRLLYSSKGYNSQGQTIPANVGGMPAAPEVTTVTDPVAGTAIFGRGRRGSKTFLRM